MWSDGVLVLVTIYRITLIFNIILNITLNKDTGISKNQGDRGNYERLKHATLLFHIGILNPYPQDPQCFARVLNITLNNDIGISKNQHRAEGIINKMKDV